MNPINTQILTARVAAGLAALTLVPLAGCGGGGSSSSTNPGGNNAAPNISGSVTDINGTPILNASVAFNGVSTTSGQSGQYSLPTGNASGLAAISASRVVNGVTWTGSNRVPLSATGATAPNIQIVISDPATQGTVTGTVQRVTSGSVGAPTVAVPNAKVLLSAAAPSSALFAFKPFGAIVAYTDGNGVFTIPNVPAATNLTLVASYTGQTNATAQGVTLTAGQTITRNFTLAPASGNYNLPAVTNFTGLSITTPMNPTRAAGAPSVESGVLAIRDYLLQKRGILTRHAAANSKIFTKATTGATRSTPAGYVIENILEWDYQANDALYGYAVLRSLNNTDNFQVYANIQDPLAERFADGDSILTPNSFYYYNLVRIDANQNEGSTAGENTVAIRPLSPINVTSPPSGSLQSRPLFQWQVAHNAVYYAVVVYDQYPQPADPANNTPATPQFWHSDDITTTAATYQGPNLTSGHTYYWAVIATDNTVKPPDTAASFDSAISPIFTFTAP